MADSFVTFVSIQPHVTTVANDGQAQGGKSTGHNTNSSVKQGLYGSRRKKGVSGGQ